MVAVGSGEENVPSYLPDGWYGAAAPNLNPLLLTYTYKFEIEYAVAILTNDLQHFQTGPA